MASQFPAALKPVNKSTNTHAAAAPQSDSRTRPAKEGERDEPKSIQMEGFSQYLTGLSLEQLRDRWFSSLEDLANEVMLREMKRELHALILKEFKRRGQHPDEYFPWPSTEALRGKNSLALAKAPEEGILKFMKYCVGRDSSLTPKLRQLVLRDIFSAHLPPIINRDYMDEWGLPRTSARLKKLAHCLASFTRNAKKKKSDMANAILRWESDLNFLYDDFYVETFGFSWPKT